MTIRDIAISFGYAVDKASEKKANDSINALKATATKLLGAIGIGFSLVALKNLSEEFGSINDKIRDATRGMGDQAEIQKTILKTANDSRMAYGDMADSISKLAGNRDVFSGVDDAARFAGLLAKEFKASGKSSEQVGSLMQSITTSMSKGVVDSRAMMTLFKESPRTLRMMADSLGVSTNALQEMVSKGQVSAKTLKNVFEANAGAIEGRFDELDINISDAIRIIRNQWGQFVSEMDSTIGITKAIAKVMVKGFAKVMSVLRKAQDGFMKLANRIGGVDKLVKLLAISAGAIFVAMNAGKILAFLKSVSKLTGIINLKVIALTAVFLIIALLVEDFIGFMQGKDSLFGEALTKAGFNLEEIRNKVRKTWDSIKKATIAIWGIVKSVILGIWSALKSWWDKNGAEFFVGIYTVFNGILDFIDGVFTGEWKTAFDGITAIVEGAIDALYSIFGKWTAVIGGAAAALAVYKLAMLGVVAAQKAGMIVAALSKAWAVFTTVVELYRNGARLATIAQMLLNGAMIANPIGLIIALIAGLVVAFVILWKKSEAFRNFFIGMWEGIKTFFSAFWIGIKEIVGGVINWVKDNWAAIALFIINPFAGIFKYLYDNFEGFRNFVDGMWESIKSGFGAVVDFFKDAIAAIVGFFQPLLDVISAVTGFIGGGLQKIGGFIGGLFGGGKGKDKSGGAYGALNDMASLGMTPRAETVAAATSSIENRAITQNVEINNTFNGDRAGQKKSAAAMEKSADDAADMLARGLSYAR